MTNTNLTHGAVIAAWLGWAFDGFDGYIYVLVAGPFVASLLDRPISDPEVASKAALIQAFFLFGWALGGVVFGRIGDRLGRARTLTLTILVYALFTGLSAAATEWWHLLIYRFIAALGIGGEWAAGSALVAESLRGARREWASAALQSAYTVGMVLAGGAVILLRGMDPRWVFLLGVLPALSTLWIRRAVRETDQWREAREREPIPSVRELFRGSVGRTTLVTLGVTATTLTTVWAFLYFGVQAVRAMPDVADWPRADVDALVTRFTLITSAAAIAGTFSVIALARALGNRLAVGIMMVGAFACFLLGFRHSPTPANLDFITGISAFFSMGLFGVYPVWIPLLFPTLIRTLGAGVSYNVGRVVAGVGILVAGEVTAGAGGPTGAIWCSGLLYVPAIVLIALMPARVRE